MSIAFKIKRGDNTTSLTDGELYLNKDLGTIQIGSGLDGRTTLVALNTTSYGDIILDGKLQANKFIGNLEGNATTAQTASHALVAEYAIATRGIIKHAETALVAETANNAPDYTRLEDFNNFTSTYNSGSFIGEFIGTSTSSSYSQISEFANLSNDVITKKYVTTGSVDDVQTIEGSITINKNLKVLGNLIADYKINASEVITQENIIKVTAHGEQMPVAGFKAINSVDNTEASIMYDTQISKWIVDKTIIGNLEGIATNSSESIHSINSDYAIQAASSSYPIELRGDTLYCGLANNVFFGKNVAEGVEGINNSVFLGSNSGRFTKNADDCVFIGYEAGDSTIDSDNSILIGYRVGKNYDGDGIGRNNIIIGTNITLDSRVSDSINIGGVLFGSGAYSDTTGLPTKDAVSNGKIGICNSNPKHTLDVNGSINVTDFLKLTPVTELPENAEVGSIICMGNEETFGLYIYTGNVWKNVPLI